MFPSENPLPCFYNTTSYFINFSVLCHAQPFTVDFLQILLEYILEDRVLPESEFFEAFGFEQLFV